MSEQSCEHEFTGWAHSHGTTFLATRENPIPASGINFARECMKCGHVERRSRLVYHPEHALRAE